MTRHGIWEGSFLFVSGGRIGLLGRAVQRATPAMLFTWFALMTTHLVLERIEGGTLGIDFFTYRQAAVSALSGGDPWTTTYAGWRFAAPPPTLLPYLPLAVLPEGVALAISVIVLGSLAVVAVRLLKAPMWWLLFPPISEALLAQNPDAAIIGLLLLGARWASVAPVLKVYAVVPLLLQRRFRAILLAGLLAAPSLVFMPKFLAHLSEMPSLLADQADGGLSAWGTWLMIPAIVALAMLGRERASWLAVPTLWPSTQTHYACIALPAVRDRPLLAAAFAIHEPYVGTAAVIATAIWDWLNARGAPGVAESGVPEPASDTDRDGRTRRPFHLRRGSQLESDLLD